MARGRRPNKVNDQYGRELYYHDGNTTIRVQEDKANNTYILIKNGKKVRSNTSIQEISDLYFQHVYEDRNIKIESEPRNVNIDSIETIKESVEQPRIVKILIDDDGTTAQDVYDVPEREIILRFMEILDKDPYKVATISKRPIFAKLDSIDLDFHIKHISDVNITLKELLDCYINLIEQDKTKKAKNRKKAISNATKWWAEFIEIINEQSERKLTYLREIDKTHIIYYINEIVNVATDKDYKQKCKWLSPVQKSALKPPYPKKTWLRHRKGMIISILQNYIDEHFLKSTQTEYKLIQHVLSYLRSSKKLKKHAKKPKPKPQAIPVETFQKLYTHAPALRWKVFLTLALNCALTFEEISDIRKDEMNIDKGELIQDRAKTEVFRSSKLDKLTCKLLKEYDNAYNSTNKSKYFFLNQDNNKLNANTCSQLFFELRKRTGISKSIKFKNIRKGVATIATQKGCNQIQIDLLMGHQLKGDLGAYVENCIETVKPACNAVCKKYFKGLKP
jgi:integrase